MSAKNAPETDYECKTVALRAEKGDTIKIDGFGEWTVARRHQTYFGPKLILSPAEMDAKLNVQLTAPGPASQLQLWWPNRDSYKWRSGWVEGPEVTAELVDTKQYDICACGEPLKSAEHQRQALMGIGEHG